MLKTQAHTCLPELELQEIDVGFSGHLPSIGLAMKIFQAETETKTKFIQAAALWFAAISKATGTKCLTLLPFTCFSTGNSLFDFARPSHFNLPSLLPDGTFWDAYVLCISSNKVAQARSLLASSDSSSKSHRKEPSKCKLIPKSQVCKMSKLMARGLNPGIPNTGWLL